MEVLTKMTVASICGNLKKQMPFGGGTELFRVSGKVEDVREVPSRFTGETDKMFVGEFAARTPDGSTYGSGKAYFPKAISNILRAGVEFAFVVLAKDDDKSAVGYVFVIKTLKEPKGTKESLLAMMDDQPELDLDAKKGNKG